MPWLAWLLPPIESAPGLRPQAQAWWALRFTPRVALLDEALLVEADGMLHPAELVEDELILALPVVPVSPDAEAVERDFAPTVEEIAQANPFAALSGWKKED